MQEVRPDAPVYIYVLRDPLKNNAIRYVGATAYIKDRLSGHLGEARFGSRRHRCNWIRKLLAAGAVPVLQVIEETTPDEWQAREQYWIALYRGLGYDLVNGTDGGEGTRGFSHTQEARGRIGAGHAKRFMLMSPAGEQFEVFNLSVFCRERGLSHSNLQSLLAGRIQWCAGWRIWRPGEAVPPAPIPKSVRMSEMFKGREVSAETRAKTSAAKAMHFIATTPTGEEIRASNLTNFCAKHSLNKASMYRILKGETEQVKGWRIRRLEEQV